MKNAALTAIISMGLIAACASQPISQDFPIAEAQAQSFFGQDLSLDASDDEANRRLGKQRNEAYVFCFEKLENEAERSSCFDWQDQSLITAHNVENYVADLRSKELKIDQFEFGPETAEFQIYHNPKLWDDAREYCYSIYRASGSKDARALGPCLSSAIGWDFFGTRPPVQ